MISWSLGATTRCCWNLPVGFGASFGAPFIVFFDSPTQHFCLFSSHQSHQYELTIFDSMTDALIYRQAFDSFFACLTHLVVFLVCEGICIAGQSKSANSGSVSNSSHHWTQQAENSGRLCIVKVTGFLCSAPRSEPIALLCWRLYLNQLFRSRTWKASENACRQRHSANI